MANSDGLFDEFFEIAKLSGKMEAIKDIFDILQKGPDQNAIAENLQNYQDKINQEFARAIVQLGDKRNETKTILHSS